jgi:hypothetical protein
MGGDEPNEPEEQYLDLVAEEAGEQAAAERDALGVLCHSLLSSIATAMSSVDAMEAPTTVPGQQGELRQIVRRQLAFIDGRLRELAGGLPTGSLTQRDKAE